jgi:hypothetical protein
MSHPHTIADIAALVQVPAGALRELADNWANFAAEYDQAAGRVTDAGRDQLLAAYTDDLLEEHVNYACDNRLFQYGVS